MSEPNGRICVFSPGLRLTITVESVPGGEEVHLHPGGQGYWVARCVERLGEEVALCATVGGEVGSVLAPLVRSQSRMDLVAVDQSAPSAVTMYDRRSGERQVIARTEHSSIDRHSVDKLYSLTLAHAIGSSCCVLAGNVDTGQIPTAYYGRLCADLAELDVPVLADLHGPELDAIIAHEAVDLVKVSDEDLRDDGVLPDDSDESLVAVVHQLADRVRRDLVVTRGPDRPAVARMAGGWFRVLTPRLAAVDWRGAGDAMVGAMAVGRLRGRRDADLLRFGAAAAAASVSRRGLASVDPELVAALLGLVEVEPVSDLEQAVFGVART